MTKPKKWKLLCIWLTSCIILLGLPLIGEKHSIVLAATVNEEKVEDVDLAERDLENAEDSEGNATESNASEQETTSVLNKLHVETTVGYNGMYMSGKSTPVNIKLTNNLSRDLKGELVLNIIDSNNYSVAHIMPLEITSGSTVEAFISADGDFSKVGTWVQFYEGGVDRGKAVDISGTRYAEGKVVSSTNAVGIAASHPDTLNFIAFLNNNGYNLTPIVLGEQFYVESSNDLSMFSVLVLNDIAAAEWSEQKIQAIKEWVAKGGLLLVGGGAGYSQISDAFEELLPVEGYQTMTWSDTTQLQQYVEQAEELAPMQIVNGKLIRGEALLTVQGIPILARNNYGNGKVVYTAFDLGLKPFTNWEGRTTLVEGLLNEQLMETNKTGRSDNWWGLDNSASFFPRLQSPQVGGLLLIFAIYSLIVAPIMYVVLRRLDRREWSWWIIPSLAIVSTIIILLIGTRDKSELYVNAVKVAYIKDHTVRETAANKVFIPNSKDISLTVPEGAYVRIHGQGMSSQNEVNTSKQQRIHYNGDERKVTFTNNKYWTTKSVMLDDQLHTVEKYGTLQAELQQSDGKYSLKISNETGKNVEHVSLVFNNQLYYIGALAANEHAIQNLPGGGSLDLMGQNPHVNYYGNSYGYMLSSMSGIDSEDLQRERGLLDYGIAINHYASIIGFSYSSDEQYVVNNKQVKSDEMLMWNVDISDLIREELQLQELISPEHTSLIGDGSFSIGEQHYISMHQEGAILIKYRIPQAEGTERTAPPVIGQFAQDVNAQHFGAIFSIFNEQLQDWEPLTDQKMDMTPYISSIGRVQIKLETTQNYFEGRAPLLLLDREVQ